MEKTELKHVKKCSTAREAWLALKKIYQTRGPARKLQLLLDLATHRMQDGDDLDEHLDKFIDNVDKLEEIEIIIPAEMLSVLMLVSLSSSFEGFRRAMTAARDDIPPPEIMKIKIREDWESQRINSSGATSEEVLFAKGFGNHQRKFAGFQ